MINFKEFLSIKDASGSISPHLAIISANRLNYSPRVNAIKSKQLENDLKNLNFEYMPFVGNSFETHEEVKLFTKEKAYLITGSAITEQNFVEYIISLLNKYEQEYGLLRFSNKDKAWKILATGNMFKFGKWSLDVQPNLPD